MIENLIRRIHQHFHTTIILSTHILPEVEATCYRAIIINKGKIVAQGTIRELSQTSRELVYATIRGDRDSVVRSPRGKGVGVAHPP